MKCTTWEAYCFAWKSHTIYIEFDEILYAFSQAAASFTEQPKFSWVLNRSASFAELKIQLDLVWSLRSLERAAVSQNQKYFAIFHLFSLIEEIRFYLSVSKYDNRPPYGDSNRYTLSMLSFESYRWSTAVVNRMLRSSIHQFNKININSQNK